MKLELELTDYEYGTLLRALDFYSRIGCGQIEELYWSDCIEYLMEKFDDLYDRRDAARFEVDAFKKVVLGLPPNGSHGIFGDVHESVKSSYDILQVIRHALYKAEDRSDWGLAADVMQTSKNLPTCKITLAT